MDELLARLRAVSRRATSQENHPSVQFGTTHVDLAGRRVSLLDGEHTVEVRLTRPSGT